MDLKLKNKVVVITGGSVGIGRAVAREFLKEGCLVAVCARRKEALDAFYDECAAAGFGERVLAFPADVTDTPRMTAFCNAVVERFGKLDIWINNAGNPLRKALMDLNREEWDACLDVNLSSVFECCKLAVREMRKTGGGVIINASSFGAVIPVAGVGVYAVAKRGLTAFTQALAAELAPDNIRVAAYTPGFFDTPMSVPMIAEGREALERQCPLNRLGKAEEIAPAIVFLASDQAGYITGTDIAVTGGKFCVQNPMFAWGK
ncbi:MAG: SDR family oxidoreductase [Deltaproteobacteria bacterium]|nr:SDR family oxidoreductase [Deltaproteobacteria bacterium]